MLRLALRKKEDFDRTRRADATLARKLPVFELNDSSPAGFESTGDVSGRSAVLHPRFNGGRADAAEGCDSTVALHAALPGDTLAMVPMK